jgi:hypothetical protein
VSGWILEQGDISSVMYVNMAITIVWLGICISLPSPGRIGSRTLQLADLVDQSANQRLDALLSVDGVVDVAIIESDQVAYLKVDEQIFDDRNLNNVARQRGEQTGE